MSVASKNSLLLVSDGGSWGAKFGKNREELDAAVCCQSALVEILWQLGTENEQKTDQHFVIRTQFFGQWLSKNNPTMHAIAQRTDPLTT